MTEAAPTGGVYADYNASAPLDPRVLDTMLPALAAAGNASSAHWFGRRLHIWIQDAREHVAALAEAAPPQVVFTSGATEANNLAIAGALAEAAPHRRRIVVSAAEHASVTQAALLLQRRGHAEVSVAAVTPQGSVDPQAVQHLLGDDVALVSVCAANGETGILNPVSEISATVRSCGALMHCDAAQAAGRIPLNVETLGVDLMSVSGHKMCGPAGVGALIASRAAKSRIGPILGGGGHERGLRPGSLNAAGIVGLGAAARLAAAEQVSEAERVSQLRDTLVSLLHQQIPATSENGDTQIRLPNTANMRFAGADADAVAACMDPVAVSAGSACSSGSPQPSAALLAMGMTAQAASESLRFSLGRFSTSADVQAIAAAAIAAVAHVRQFTS